MTPATVRIPEEIRLRARLERGIYSLQYIMDRIESTDPKMQGSHSSRMRARKVKIGEKYISR